MQVVVNSPLDHRFDLISLFVRPPSRRSADRRRDIICAPAGQTQRCLRGRVPKANRFEPPARTTLGPALLATDSSIIFQQRSDPILTLQRVCMMPADLASGIRGRSPSRTIGERRDRVSAGFDEDAGAENASVGPEDGDEAPGAGAGRKASVSLQLFKESAKRDTSTTPKEAATSHRTQDEDRAFLPPHAEQSEDESDTSLRHADGPTAATRKAPFAAAPTYRAHAVFSPSRARTKVPPEFRSISPTRSVPSPPESPALSPSGFPPGPSTKPGPLEVRRSTREGRPPAAGGLAAGPHPRGRLFMDREARPKSKRAPSPTPPFGDLDDEWSEGRNSISEVCLHSCYRGPDVFAERTAFLRHQARHHQRTAHTNRM